jgi:superfamily II DNA or RNA helicase
MISQLEAPVLKRSLLLRPYQVPASDFAIDTDIAVLALCPNGGKTEVSIDVIRRYLDLNPFSRVLVLSHSTNVLKTNYIDRLDGLELGFDYSTTFDQDCRVHVCLPHSEHLIVGTYDFLIVDEAHENYLEKRVQRIIKKIKPQKQLLLTGSPSKFIKRGGYNIFTLAVNELPEEYFAKLNIELVASNYNWAKSYNNDLEVKSDYKFETIDTKKTLETIVLKLVDRVKKGLTAEEFNNPNLIAKFKSWAFTYKQMGKTMIICKSVSQATDVNNILISNGVSSTVSDHKSDKDSSEIASFKNNKYDVLVVVDRARLGYSDDALFNIIDMSGTHNPDIIYQIFCRVLRGTPDMKKYYLKVTTQEYGMMDFTHACVCAALMLTDHKYLSTFNGNNFNGIKIPVLKNKTGKTSASSGGKSDQNKKFVFPEFTNDVIDMFKNIIHNLDEPVSIYKLTTISEVKAMMSGRTVWTWEELLETAR